MKSLPAGSLLFCRHKLRLTQLSAALLFVSLLISISQTSKFITFYSFSRISLLRLGQFMGQEGDGSSESTSNAEIRTH
jgi:hypothetical protein